MRVQVITKKKKKRLFYTHQNSQHLHYDCTTPQTHERHLSPIMCAFCSCLIFFNRKALYKKKIITKMKPLKLLNFNNFKYRCQCNYKTTSTHVMKEGVMETKSTHLSILRIWLCSARKDTGESMASRLLAHSRTTWNNTSTHHFP